MERYFVVVLARDADGMRALQKFEFDLFAQTAKRSGRDKDYPFSIDGLLSPPEIEQLKQAGYRVQVQDPVEKRARGAQNPADFSQWIQGMQPALASERAAAARASAATAKKAAAAGRKTGRKKPAARKKPKGKAAKRK
jgi:hypothetical protein